MKRFYLLSMGVLLFPMLYALTPDIMEGSAIAILSLSVVALAFSLIPVVALCRRVLRDTSRLKAMQGDIARW